METTVINHALPLGRVNAHFELHARPRHMLDASVRTLTPSSQHPRLPAAFTIVSPLSDGRSGAFALTNTRLAVRNSFFRVFVIYSTSPIK